MSTDPVLYERRDAVVVLTLNRPERLNALSGELMERFGSIIRELERSRDLGCVVVTGAGRGFCSGGDVGGMADRDRAAAAAKERPPGSEIDALEEQVAGMRLMHRDVVMAFYQLPIPTLALVNGAAAGASMSLAAGADLRIASDKAFFTTAFGR